MDYTQPLSYHFRPRKGWINDPNGLVFFKGYYHVFYQHAPDFEVPWKQPMHWGHARTKDFITFEELPVALYPDKLYDTDGCWSGTAIVKDGVLYLFYASIRKDTEGHHAYQTVSVATSTDGIHFEKYAGNPVIDHFPADGGKDFRDPAVCFANGHYYCVMATGHPETKTGRLLLYQSNDLLAWHYLGIMSEWANCKYTECPSFLPAENGFLLTASVCPLDKRHYFSVMYGKFQNGTFTPHTADEVDKGPDQYAGQAFRDHLGRNVLLVAHNINFDMGMLQQECALCEDATWELAQVKLCNTILFAYSQYPEFSSRNGGCGYALETLIEQLGIDAKNSHRADDDADACAKLFFKLAKTARYGR